MAAFDTFRRKAITVILETKKVPYKNSISPLIRGALTQPKMGNIIPKVVATSSQGDELWGSMSYAQLKSKKGLKDLSKELAAIQKGEAEPPNDDDLFPRWNLEKKIGYGVNGKFVKLENGQLHLHDPKGKKFELELSKLSAPAIAYAKMMAGEKEKEVTKATAPKEEDWTNTKGTILKATFISLDGEKITLKLANGKASTFALNLLSEESQTRAKSYAK